MAVSKTESVSLIQADSGARIILEKDRILVGRGTKAGQIRLRSRLVNRVHALLDKKGGKVRVTDLESGNGTWLNGCLLPPGTYTELTDGDEIMFADEVFRFEKKERIIRDYEKDVSDHDNAHRAQHPCVHYL